MRFSVFAFVLIVLRFKHIEMKTTKTKTGPLSAFSPEGLRMAITHTVVTASHSERKKRIQINAPWVAGVVLHRSLWCHGENVVWCFSCPNVCFLDPYPAASEDAQGRLLPAGVTPEQKHTSIFTSASFWCSRTPGASCNDI